MARRARSVHQQDLPLGEDVAEGNGQGAPPRPSAPAEPPTANAPELEADDPATIAREIITDLAGAIVHMEAIEQELAGGGVSSLHPTSSACPPPAPPPSPYDLDAILETLRAEDPDIRLLIAPARRTAFATPRKGEHIAGAVIGGEPCFCRLGATATTVPPPGLLSLSARPVSMHAALAVLWERAPDAYEALLSIVRELGADEEPRPEDARGDSAYFMAKMDESTVYAEMSSRCITEAHAALIGKSVPEAQAELERARAATEAEKNARRAETRSQRQAVKEAGETAHASVDAKMHERRSRGAAKVATTALDKGMRALTPRQQELLAIVRVENGAATFGGGRIPDWTELKIVLEALGGRYICASKNKPGRFVWEEGTDVEEVIRVVREDGEILDPKLLGFFATPAPLADELVGVLRPRPGEVALEPNGGKGAIVLALRRACPSLEVRVVELLPENAEELRTLGLDVIEADFLTIDPGKAAPVDLVGMNPPFGDGADVRHVLHAARFLRPGGRGASIMSGEVEFRNDALTDGFRMWIGGHGGEIRRLPDGSFKSSGTMVRTAMTWWTACENCGSGACQGHLR